MSNEKLELILMYSFGFGLLIVFGLIARGIALHHVEEATSYGLPVILNSLSGLGGAWGALVVSRKAKVMKDDSPDGEGSK